MNSLQDNIKVAIVQHACSNDVNANNKIIYDSISVAARKNVDLVLLQELHSHIYFCQQQDQTAFELASSIPNENTNELCRLARRYKLVIITSVFEKRAKGLYHNTAIVIDKSGDIAGMYRKTHIPNDPGYYEKYYFSPGDAALKPIDTSIGKLGLMICWDQWFPEAARLMALAGADILLYPTAIGWDPTDTVAEQQRQIDAWVTIQRSHAIANLIPVVVCNRVGFEPDSSGMTKGIHFWGSSFMTDSMGSILTMAQQTPDKCGASVHTAEINFAETEKQRRVWPFLRDRRTDLYSDIVLRYRD